MQHAQHTHTQTHTARAECDSVESACGDLLVDRLDFFFIFSHSFEAPIVVMLDLLFDRFFLFHTFCFLWLDLWRGLRVHVAAARRWCVAGGEQRDRSGHPGETGTARRLASDDDAGCC